MSCDDWELAAALAVLRQAQREAAELRDVTGDPKLLYAAERRCGSALRIVKRIRDGLNRDLAQRRNDYAPPASRHGEVHG